MFSNPSRLFLLTFFCLLTVACSSRMEGINNTARALLGSPDDVSVVTKLNPSVRYLRVVAAGNASLLALGYVDAHPSGPIDVWYSSKGDVLRLQNGHVASLTGGPVEWRHVKFTNLPSWSVGQASNISYMRTRDVMPGYLFGQTDSLELRRAAAPVQTNFMQAKGAPPIELQWYEAVDLSRQLPTARFATQLVSGVQTAVYGEQCLSKTFCLSWQQWPPSNWPK